jgi:hypothetical protein
MDNDKVQIFQTRPVSPFLFMSAFYFNGAELIVLRVISKGHWKAVIVLNGGPHESAARDF